MKKLYILPIILVLSSCSKQKIEGVYFVNNDKSDKVYIELIDIEKDLYKISTPYAWTEFATIHNGEIRGEWEYSKDYYDKEVAGMKGTHIGIYSKQEFNVRLFVNQHSVGKVTWKRLSSSLSNSKDKKTIYLTFDDGPFDGTPNVLLALDKTKVKATFFLVGKHAKELRKKHTNTLEALKDNKSILLANHSYSHANGQYATYYKSSSTVIDDLEKNEKEILYYNTFWKGLFSNNINANIVRLPGRNVWMIDDFEFFDVPDVKKISKKLKRTNFKIYGWDVEWDMKKGRPSINFEEVVNRIENKFTKHQNKFSNRCVILMHDRMFYENSDKEKLIYLINLLKEKGYKFETLDNFL